MARAYFPLPGFHTGGGIDLAAGAAWGRLGRFDLRFAAGDAKHLILGLVEHPWRQHNLFEFGTIFIRFVSPSQWCIATATTDAAPTRCAAPTGAIAGSKSRATRLVAVRQFAMDACFPQFAKLLRFLL